MLNRMNSLADKIRAKGEMVGAVAELAEEKVKPKAKVLAKKLKVKGQVIKVGNKKNKQKHE